MNLTKEYINSRASVILNENNAGFLKKQISSEISTQGITLFEKLFSASLWKRVAYVNEPTLKCRPEMQG